MASFAASASSSGCEGIMMGSRDRRRAKASAIAAMDGYRRILENSRIAIARVDQGSEPEALGPKPQ
eukprot:1094552-Prymnesium_polylepis.2